MRMRGVSGCLAYFTPVIVITWDWVVHSPTGVALESAPSQYLGLADRVVCSGTVLAQPFK